MTIISGAPRDLSDRDLLTHIARAAEAERHATAQLIALLAELDTRRLYLGEGFSSLFTYCTQALHFAEHAAYNQIEAARAVRRYPIILELLATGAITLAAVRLLAPHLTAENHRDVLARARQKSKREVEVLVATLCPRVDVPSTVRKLPAPRTPQMPPVPAQETLTPDVPPFVDTRPSPSLDAPPRLPAPQAPQIKPLAPERYKIQFTVSRETYNNSGEPKTCSGAAARMAIRRLSSNAPSRYWLRNSNARGPARRRILAMCKAQRSTRGTFRRP